jgi:hypothetical protein
VKEIFQLEPACTTCRPIGKAQPSIDSIHKPSTAAVASPGTTPPSHPVAPTPSFSSSQLPALPCSPSLTSARLRAINLSPIRSSPSYHHHFTDSPCRSANGYCTGRLCYPPSGAGRSPSARRRRRPAGAPADAPSELKVLPRPQIPPLTEK